MNGKNQSTIVWFTCCSSWCCCCFNCTLVIGAWTTLWASVVARTLRHAFVVLTRTFRNADFIVFAIDQTRNINLVEFVQALFLLLIRAVSIADTIRRVTLGTTIYTITMAWTSRSAVLYVVIAFDQTIYVLFAVQFAYIKQYITVGRALMTDNCITNLH